MRKKVNRREIMRIRIRRIKNWKKIKRIQLCQNWGGRIKHASEGERGVVNFLQKSSSALDPDLDSVGEIVISTVFVRVCAILIDRVHKRHSLANARSSTGVASWCDGDGRWCCCCSGDGDSNEEAITTAAMLVISHRHKSRCGVSVGVDITARSDSSRPHRISSSNWPTTGNIYKAVSKKCLKGYNTARLLKKSSARMKG